MTAAAPYDARLEQRRASVMGMCVFLASEVMLFGGLLVVLLSLRLLHPQEVVAASRQLHLWLGATNTAVLLTSSLAVAVAVHAARTRERRAAAWLLGAAGLLGVLFLAIKALEYAAETAEGRLPLPGSQLQLDGPVHRLFMDLYLIATALHAIHVAIGIAMLAALGIRLGLRRFDLHHRATTVEAVGLYWHFVDVVWIFLFPLLYLVR
jgi:cytochrome c oxidase subunit 3